MALDPLASGLLSILAALVAAGGTLYQGLQKQQADRDKEQRARDQLQAERTIALLEARLKAAEDRVKALEDKDHEHDLVLVRTDGDLKHMRSAIDEVRDLVRQLAGLPVLRPQIPPHSGGE